MRHLNRPVAPACLSTFTSALHTWRDVTSADKAQIWVGLDLMQENRCAYCESGIGNPNRHIEHFVQRSVNQSLTFNWPNLFGSCNRTDSCGKFKDKEGRPYDPMDLIKPDVENPEDFLAFQARGSVRAKAGLTVDSAKRANETIRVFNLNGSLAAIRGIEVSGYIQTAEYFAELIDAFPQEEWMPLLQEEIDQTSHLPFATAIKHVLTMAG